MESLEADEPGNRWGFLFQWIDVRGEVAEIAVGRDEPDRSTLPADVVGRGRADLDAAELHAGEEGLPARFHGGRVGPPPAILLLHQVAVERACEGGGGHETMAPGCNSILLVYREIVMPPGDGSVRSRRPGRKTVRPK